MYIKVDQDLELRLPTLDDAYDMYEYASDPEVSKYLPWDPHASLAESEFVISNYFVYDNTNPNFGIFYEGKMVGTCGASNPHDGTVIEVGYALSKKLWGKGIATKCLKAYINWAKQHGFNKFIARVLDENIASVKVIEKCGFRKNGNVISHSGIEGPEYELNVI